MLIAHTKIINISKAHIITYESTKMHVNSSEDATFFEIMNYDMTAGRSMGQACIKLVALIQ